MAVYSFAQLEAFAQKAGFQSIEIPIIAAIALAESNGNSAAHNQHGPTSNSLAENSYGLLQINLLAHPDVSVNDALDPQKAFDEGFKLFQARGGQFTDWSTYTSGAFLARVPNTSVPGAAQLQLITDYWIQQMGLNPLKPPATTTKDPFLNFIDTLSKIPVLGAAFQNAGPGLEDFSIRTAGIGFSLSVILVGVIALIISGVTQAASTKAGQVAETFGGFAVAGKVAGNAAGKAATATPSAKAPQSPPTPTPPPSGSNGPRPALIGPGSPPSGSGGGATTQPLPVVEGKARPARSKLNQNRAGYGPMDPGPKPKGYK